jgi:hypothetical protein
MTNYLRRYARRDDISRRVMPDYGPSADHGPVTDRDPAQNTDAGTNPHIRSNFYRSGYTRLFIDPTVRMHPVIVMRDKAAGRDHRMIANHNTIDNIKLSSSSQKTKTTDFSTRRIRY